MVAILKYMWGFLRRNRILYSIIFIYGVFLVLRAAGIPMWLPPCPFSTYLGIECFGCGINRAAISFLQMDFSGAWNYNPLFFVYLVFLMTWIIYDFYKYWKEQSDYSLNNNPNESI